MESENPSFTFNEIFSKREPETNVGTSHASESGIWCIILHTRTRNDTYPSLAITRVLAQISHSLTHSYAGVTCAAAYGHNEQNAK